MRILASPRKKLARMLGCRVIGDWFEFYNQKRPHQVLKMNNPAQAYAQAA